jgi:hypothetical protein
VSTYDRAIGAITSEEGLHFCFESERDFLRVPLEFLFADGEYLVLKHPLARFIKRSMSTVNNLKFYHYQKE